MIAQTNIETLEKVNPRTYWNTEKVYSIDEYFNLEEKAPFKSEFHNGKIYPMPNGSTNHGKIIGSLFFLLKLASMKLEQNTLVCLSEIKVFIEAINQAFYPDTFIRLVLL